MDQDLLHEDMNIPDYAAPCGVYCKACESYGKTCTGCRSEKAQKRKSKYGCKIRTCAFEKNIDFCINCKDFPCKIYTNKLLKTHKEDPRFQYRRDAPEDMKIIKDSGFEEWEKYQEGKWKCNLCGGTIMIYSYQCKKCKHEFLPREK